MRFQDAARDGRAVVYAAIQAEPLVARAGELLADAERGDRILARAPRLTTPTITETGTSPAGSACAQP